VLKIFLEGSPEVTLVCAPPYGNDFQLKEGGVHHSIFDCDDDDGDYKK